jgi:hypothetical protein
MKSPRISMAATVGLLLMAGCGVWIGPGSTSTYPNGQNARIQGVVTNIDINEQRIDLTVNNQYNSSVYYDSRTQFSYGNQTVSASSIRRGDQLDIRAYNNRNGEYTADTVYVVNSGMASNYPGSYPKNNSGTFRLQGTVSYVDTSAQRIDVNGNQGTFSIDYDSRTPVYYQGQSFSPTQLERGDQIDISAFDNGGHSMASSITVTRNIRQ